MEWYSVLQISFHENNFKAYPLHSPGTFEDVLRAFAANAGIANWLEVLHVEDGMLIYQGLRLLLNMLGIPVLGVLDPEGGRLVLLVFLGGVWATGQAADQRLYGRSSYTEGRSGSMPNLRGEHPS